MTRSVRRLQWLLCLVLLLPSLAAAERKPYFSVSTNRSFAPGEKIRVTMYSQDVDALEFRLYRIPDPTSFFLRLDNVHSFGAEPFLPGSRERIDERTWLERFHDWKMDVWHSIRNFFRYQFTPDARAAFRRRQVQSARRTRILNAAQFAQVPALNSKLLIARWQQEIPKAYFSDQQDLPVDPQPSGAYLVEATDGNLKAYTIVLVSRTVLVTKVAEGQLLAFLVNRDSGAPVADAKVTFWTGKQDVHSARTEADGTASFQSEAKTEELRTIATSGDDVAVVAPYAYMFAASRRQHHTAYVYTDRPVYRPGHTVHWKAMLRDRIGDKLQVTAPGTVRVRILAEGEKEMLNGSAQISSAGDVHGEFEVPSDAPLGYYRIELTDVDGGASFYVEDYKKPEYLVKVTPERARVLQGEQIKATIEARYFFGEPVANAKVKYVVHTSPHYNWDEADEEYRGDEEGGEGEEGAQYDYAGTEREEQEGTLDANGRLVITLPTAVDDKNKLDQNYRIEARVTDAANREISGHNVVLATYGNFKLSVRAESYVYRAGQTPRVFVTAKDYDEKPIQTAVHVELIRPRWWLRSQAKGESDEVLASRDVQTGADGTVTFEWPTQGQGSLEIRATAKSGDRELQSISYLWIVGAENIWANGERKIRLVADKKSYKPGDVANILVLAGDRDAHVLITTEARSIQSHQVVEAKGGSGSVQVPITATMQPNIIVSAVAIEQSTLYQGTLNVKVPAQAQRLTLEITPSKPQFQPGEKASYDVLVKDADGKPAIADLSVGVVDDAIYSVRPDISGDILNTFYPRNYPMYNTDSSLTFFFSGRAGKKSPLLELSKLQRSLATRRLAQIKPGADLVQPKVRKAFPDTAFWAPAVMTDSSGHARVSLNFPDSLTTWRTTVRAITASTQAGSDINRVVVRKNLMVRLAAPRFFREGDEVTVSTIVHNYLTTAKTARVSLDVTGLDTVGSSAPRDVTVPVRGEAKVDWRLRAKRVGNAVLTTKALTNEESDAMEVTLPVEAFGVKMAIPRSGSISGEGNDSSNIAFPASEAQSRSIDLTVSPSIAASLFSALDFLTSYPYGCTEQTMSSFLPDVIVSQTMKQLDLKTTISPQELTKMIHAGTERLYDYQHDDGGWGWWKDDQSQVYMTAYVVFGLSQAKASGYEVDQQRLDRGRQWLRDTLREHPNMIADLEAYVVYALASSGDRNQATFDRLWGKREKLTPEGLAHAGLAFSVAGDVQRAQALANDLLRSAQQNEAEAWWTSRNDYLLDLYEQDDSVEATASALKLLATVTPNQPLLPKVARWLIDHRDEGLWWISTKQTATVIYGLIEYVKASHELEADFTVDVTVNGTMVLKHHFSAAESTVPVTVHLESSQLSDADAVALHKTGTGRLYWSARGNYYSTQKKDFQSGTLNLNVTRDYYRLRPVKREDKIVYAMDPLSGPVQTGDILAVRLGVSGGEWKYLLIEDPIPAGTEFIERDDLYELESRPSWWGEWWSRREFHDDRAAFFAAYFQTRHEYTYLLKVVNPGVFPVSPALVQPMYQPSVMATSDPVTVEVK